MTSISEKLINNRRNWKAETFSYDHYLPDESEECQYCLTKKQAEVLRGIIEPLAWDTRWWSDSDTAIDRDQIEQFRNDIARRLMMTCCGNETPIQYRYTSEGVLQKSTDGGETWEDAPQDDVRNNSTKFPPMEGEDGTDKKCLAATGAAALLKEQVGDQLTDDMGRYTLSQLITDWVKTMIQTSNPFQALLTVVVNQIFALVISALRPALTDGVYSTFKCILYCRMADDASFNDAQWSSVRSDVTSKISGIAGVFLEHLVYLLGKVGLTNLCRAGGATEGDCSACGDCTAQVWFINSDHTTFSLQTEDEGHPGQYTLPAVLDSSRGVYVWYQFFQDITGASLPWKGGNYLSYTSISGFANFGVYDKDTGTTTASRAPVSGECWGGFYIEALVPFTVTIVIEPC